jgi:hypothetical protein
MGKSALITVLEMMVIISFLILKLNASSKENLSTTVDMFDQTQSRLISNTGVEIYIEKVYADSTLINTTSSTQDLFGGTYVAEVSGALPNIRVKTTSNFMGVQHISVADAFLQPVNFPNPPGGIYISTNAVVSASEIGDMNVNGLNHDINANVLTDSNAVWGVGVDNQQQVNDIIAGLKKPQHIFGLTDTLGNTGYPSVGITSLGVDWAKIYQFLSNAADQTFINDIPNGADLGNLTSPKITLINADANSNKNIMVNGGNGAGILVVNGNIKFAGNFNFKGIILCYKNSDLSFESVGTNQVLGGIIIAGKNVSFKLSGTMDVMYSLDVVNIVRANLKSDGFKILSWYE